MGSIIYIGDSSGIVATDTAFNILNKYLPAIGGGFYQLYYNQKNNTLITSNTGDGKIEILDLNLVLKSTISVSSVYGAVYGAYMYNDIIYASTDAGKIVITDNVVVVKTLNTLCNNILFFFFLYIDPCGLIALPCEFNKRFYFYYINGTKLSTEITLNDYPTYIGRDYNDKLIIVSYNTIYKI